MHDERHFCDFLKPQQLRKTPNTMHYHGFLDFIRPENLLFKDLLLQILIHRDQPIQPAFAYRKAVWALGDFFYFI